jgi:hypothetical protein
MENNYKMREELSGLEQAEVAVPSPTSDYRPSNKEALREHEIRIRFLSRGCVVSVGCQEIAFESVKNAMDAINDYIVNPYNEQQRWKPILR